MFEAWQLAAIDEAGYNGIRDEYIEKVANSLSAAGVTELDREAFENHCRKCGIDPDNFTQSDLDQLRNKLNR